MTLIGNAEGKLHVQRQVENYALRGVEFEDMGFLTFTVETYERRIDSKATTTIIDEEEQFTHSMRERSGRYLDGHLRNKTHIRTCRLENHNSLPNIIGPWLPRRDGDEETKSYYYTAMLSFLKPWRNLHALKSNDEIWESAFNTYIQGACQRNRDVVAGCQYFYDSRTQPRSRDLDDEIEIGGDELGERSDDVENDCEGGEDDPLPLVSRIFDPLSQI